MNTTTWFLGIVVAVGVILVASEVSPEATNALLILVLIGIVLTRWAQIAPLVGLAGKVAGGEGYTKGT